MGYGLNPTTISAGAFHVASFSESCPASKPANPQHAPFKEITFHDGGSNRNPLRLWTGDTMIDLEKLQALKMIVKGEHLFIEAGSFSERNPVGWKSPVTVMKKAAG